MTTTVGKRPSGWLLRHAQSLSNTGAPSDPQTTPLSPVGRQQAAWVANRLHSAFPTNSAQRLSHIITSDLPRTQETVAPLLALQPDLTHEIWPIQEFVNLPDHLARHQDASARQQAIADYWEHVDPEAAAEGAESFLNFIQRVDEVIQRLPTIDHSRILMCGHGIFLTALCWRLFAFPLLSREIQGNPVAFKQDFGHYLAKNMWKNSVLRPFSVNSSGLIRIRKPIKPPSFPHREMVKER